MIEQLEFEFADIPRSSVEIGQDLFDELLELRQAVVLLQEKLNEVVTKVNTEHP